MPNPPEPPAPTPDDPPGLAERLDSAARQWPQRLALVDDQGGAWTRQALERRTLRIARTLQQRGVRPGDVVATLAGCHADHVIAMLGALRAGAAVALLPTSAAEAALQGMLDDAAPKVLFADGAEREMAARLRSGAELATIGRSVPGMPVGARMPPIDDWLAPDDGQPPQPVQTKPTDAFNIIYSSGTTGRPKGIVQSHGMRALHVMRGASHGYGPDAVTLISTPIYSNTTLVALLPALALGGTVHLMARFDAARWLARAAAIRATHTMLVPVQYQRLLDDPSFDGTDLSAFQTKFCTSAPFSAALKAEVLRRWPGELIEYYGMTEGGGTVILKCRAHPDKLHTVGQPAPGHDIRLIDNDGREVAAGEVGEVVGHSRAMMTGYHHQPEATAQAIWYAPDGRRFIRTGDVGRFDADGFLQLMDRRKDMVISGGFNLYPSDLEAVLREHPAVGEAAVVGRPSRRWGETPVAFVELRAGQPAGDATAAEIHAWTDARLGRTQRLAELHLIDRLPRGPIGKVLKRELRDVAAGLMPKGDRPG